jgi:hypothetical protein
VHVQSFVPPSKESHIDIFQAEGFNHLFVVEGLGHRLIIVPERFERE